MMVTFIRMCISIVVSAAASTTLWTRMPLPLRDRNHVMGISLTRLNSTIKVFAKTAWPSRPRQLPKTTAAVETRQAMMEIPSSPVCVFIINYSFISVYFFRFCVF